MIQDKQVKMRLVNIDFMKSFGILAVTFEDDHGNRKTSSAQFKKSMTAEEFEDKINKMVGR